jgi:glycosyltransferase involved in cell wall biosynthesis
LICFIATNVVFVTEDLQRDFIDAKLVAPAKAVVIGPGSACGIDLSEYDLSQFSAEEKVRQRRNLGVEDGRFVVLYIGRPYKRKGFHFLLNYWARRGRNLCDGQLFLAGCSAEDVHSVLGFPLRPEITPVGYVTDLRPYLSAADVVVLPSEHEGFSYSVLEAFAAGRCVIASDVPGLRTQVMHEQTGLLFPYGNEEEFHAKLAAIRQSDILRTSLETAARRFAERYSRPSYLRHFLVTMSALIRGAADAGPASNT